MGQTRTGVPSLLISMLKSLRIEKIKIIAASLLISFLVVAVYAPVHSFEFLNFDDNVYVSANPFVLGGVRKEGIAWAFSSTEGGHWHPLSWISHMIDVEVFGVDPQKMHMLNVLLHLGNSLLLFFVAFLVFNNTELALLAALTFSLHPLRLESVAWISQRKDLLSLFFGLLAVVLFLRYLRARVVLAYVASIVVFSLALLSKPSMITLPVLLLIVELAWTIRNEPARVVSDRNSFFSLRAHFNKIPYVVLALACAVTAILSQREGGGLRNLGELALGDRLMIALPAYVAYFGKLFWPFNLSVYYPIVHYPSGLAFGCFACLLLISIICWTLRGRYPELVLGWIWFLVALVPMIGIVAIGAQALADRWTQLAHIGLIAGLLSLTYRCNQRYTRAACWVVVISLSLATHRELKYWKDSETLFRRALQSDPNNFMAHTNLGAALLSPEDSNERVFHYEEAVRLNPTYPEALSNLGVARAEQGELSEAIRHFEQALRINPNLEVARRNLAIANSDVRARRGR